MPTEDEGVQSLTCLDCKTSGKFISLDGKAYFKLMHAGHRVVEDTPAGGPGAPEVGGGEPGLPRPPSRRKGSFESMAGGAGEAPPKGSEESPKEREPERLEEPPMKPLAPKPAPESPGVAAKEEPAPKPRPDSGKGGKQPEGATQAIPSGELFLARTSYVDSTPEAEQEARRVSRVLAQFRWNVTPPYTVSMVFSDLLCITSESGSIPRELIERIEGLGYAFSGFEANNSRPLAWFKKLEEEEPRKEVPPEPQDPRLEELAKTIQSQGVQIEEEMAKIDEERTKVAEQLKALSSPKDSVEQGSQAQ